MKKTAYITLIHITLMALYTFAMCYGIDEEYSFQLDTRFQLPLFLLLALHLIVGILMIIVLTVQRKYESLQAHFLGLMFVLLFGGTVCYVVPQLYK